MMETESLPENPVIRLCIRSTQAEFAGQIGTARMLCQQAWQVHTDDFEACIAAHYLARYQDDAEACLRWNQEALTRALAVGDDRVKSFFPSLYINLGYAYELLGNTSEVQRYYALAAELGLEHQPCFSPPLLM